MQGFWTRLQKRKLPQWALAYLAVGWVLLEAFGFVADRFGWAEGLVRAATILMGVGLLAVLVLAWFHGERGRQRVGFIEALLLAILGVSGGALLWTFGPPEPSAVSESVTLLPALDSLADRSIAVLPFENRSGDEQDAYFSDGIHEEILTRLLNVSALRVISRTSVMQYRDRSENLRTIGRELGARYMLEGGVQRAGDRVRITVQLVDARGDQSLWAQSYDRELTVENLFSIQSEVATSIAVALDVNLSLPERAGLNVAHTSDLEAYNLFLQGKQLQRRFTEDGLRGSVEAFEQAIALDPGFARAHAALGASYIWFGHGFTDVRPLEVYPLARALGERTLELDPNSAEGHALLGHLLWEVDWEPEAAERSLRLAIELSPSSVEAHQILGWILLEAGRFEEGQEEAAIAYTLDPLSSESSRSLADAFRVSKQFDRAILLYENTLRLHPDDWLGYLRLGKVHLSQGDMTQALDAIERAVALNPSARARGSLGYAYGIMGERERARTILDELYSDSEAGYIWPLAPAMIHAGLGENDLAMRWLETANEERVTQLVWLDTNYPEFEGLHDDPRFQAILTRVSGRE